MKGQWHDNRHTLITELAESGAGDQTIMDIAGHVSRQMLARYRHIRMEANRYALDALVRRRRAAHEAPQAQGEPSNGTPTTAEPSNLVQKREAAENASFRNH